MQDEKMLIKECLKGNEAAWRDLYRHLYEELYLITRWKKWYFPPEAAEDVMQEAYMHIVKSLENFKFESSLLTYASNITKRLCIEEIRRVTAIKRKTNRDAVAFSDVESVVAAGSAHVDADDGQNETLNAALEEIDPPCRNILKLKFYDECSYKEISLLLNIATGTVGSRMQRCIVKLKKIIEKNAGDDCENTVF
ncbi:MAG: sigma-70 family RNA polymerase sigma factor [Deltaproteobacteria bacterium]|nr:sigma-70 family RNA polymerase sigma factor [Deltaproteobacteria bacterium]